MKLSTAILGVAGSAITAVSQPLQDQKPLNVDDRFDLIQECVNALGTLMTAVIEHVADSRKPKSSQQSWIHSILS